MFVACLPVSLAFCLIFVNIYMSFATNKRANKQQYIHTCKIICIKEIIGAISKKNMNNFVYIVFDLLHIHVCTYVCMYTNIWGNPAGNVKNESVDTVSGIWQL